MPKKNSIADLVAVNMAGLINSDEYKSIFSPSTIKTASVKETPKTSSKQEQFKLVVQGMAKMSEVLDVLGLTKSSTLALQALETMIVEAGSNSEEDCMGADDKDAEEKENTAIDLLQDAQKEEDKSEEDEPAEHLEDEALDLLEKAQKMEGADDNDGLPSVPMPGSPGSVPERPMPPHNVQGPGLHEVPGGGYSKPQQPPPQRRLPSGQTPEPMPQSADDLDYDEVHGAYDSAINVKMEQPEVSKASVELHELLTSLGLDTSGIDKGTLVKEAKEKGRGDFIFPASSSKVKDNKSHFPINTEGRARNALARANQYSKAPPWYKGSLQSLVDSVVRAVHRKYKGIEISENAKVPGKGGAKKKKAWHDYLDNTIIVQALNYADYDEPNFDPDYAEMYEDIRWAADRTNDSTLVVLAKPKSEFALPSSHPHVKSGNHFPLNTEGRARNALARVNQYSKAPSWWSGSLKSLVDTVVRAVHKKYKGIEISKKSKKPGKG